MITTAMITEMPIAPPIRSPAVASVSWKIAAIAPVTANMPKVHAAKRPSRPMPILLMNGTADPLVPYDGGHITLFGKSRGEVMSTQQTAMIFAATNGCTGEHPTTKRPDLARKDGTRVLVRRAKGCSQPVVIYRIEGGGHTWPGGKQYLPKNVIGTTSRDISGTYEIFNFFDGK